jgi:hypothetical protein
VIVVSGEGDEQSEEEYEKSNAFHQSFVFSRERASCAEANVRFASLTDTCSDCI